MAGGDEAIGVDTWKISYEYSVCVSIMQCFESILRTGRQYGVVTSKLHSQLYVLRHVLVVHSRLLHVYIFVL
jgi:hypothetical protein